MAPLYVYVIALLVGAPVFFLWAVGAYLGGKGLLSWVLAPEADAVSPALQPESKKPSVKA